MDSSFDPRFWEKTLTLPTENDYRHALRAYRERWPNDGYFDQNERFIENYRLLRRYYSSGQIADIGGWPGDFSCTLASLGFKVLLIDKDPARPTSKVFDPQSSRWVLATAGTLAEKCRLYGVEVIKCDIEREKIPLAAGALNFIIFTEVIEHLRVGILPALRELRRALKPSGTLLVTTPNLLSLKNRLSFLTGRAQYDTLEMPYDALDAEERIGHAGHFRVFSMPELVDLLQRTDFHICYCGYRQISTMGKVRRPSIYAVQMGLYNRLIQWLPQFGNQLDVVASRD